MTTQRSARSTFPLRFENERTRDLLRVIAKQQHTSMNQLAEAMIERELGVLALGLESSLSRTMELLRSYRGEGRAVAWAAFAGAEALPEPIAARRIHPEEDPFGVAQAFEVGA
jgi:alpha-L-fucosidase